MNKKFEDIIINKIYIEYQREYNVELPALRQIKRSKGSDGSVVAEELYKKKYILSIDSQLMNSNDVRIYSVLYHEFTHIKDSILLSKYSYDKYRNLMNSYSEFHATTIETEKRLTYSDNLQDKYSYITTNNGYMVQIEEYVQKSFNHVVNDYKKMIESTVQTIYFDPVSLFYHIGKLKAFKNINIYIPFEFEKICPEFRNVCEKMYKICMEDKINLEIVEQTYLEIEDIFKSNLTKSKY